MGKEGRLCQRERWHGCKMGKRALVKEALRVPPGGREQGLSGGDRRTDGAGPLWTEGETRLKNSELLKGLHIRK